MTKTVDSATAGRELGRQIAQAMHGNAPDAVIVFASSRHTYAALLETLTPCALQPPSDAG